jgi:hypothetical protein
MKIYRGLRLSRNVEVDQRKNNEVEGIDVEFE